MGIVRMVLGRRPFAFIEADAERLGHRHDVRLGILRGADAVKAVLIVGVMTVHSFTEGRSRRLVRRRRGAGRNIGLAIAVHNIPEGLAISLVLVPRGISASGRGLECVLEPCRSR